MELAPQERRRVGGVGGRPPHPIKDILLVMIDKLGRARLVDLERYYSRIRPGQFVSNHTIKRHAEGLVAQGILKREVELDSTPKVKAGERSRFWQMVWYSIR